MKNQVKNLLIENCLIENLVFKESLIIFQIIA